MPYLDPKSKKMMDDGVAPETAGELTYCLTKQIQRYLELHAPSYEGLAVVLGSIEGCKADFIARVLMPYEAEKRKTNGDVWPVRGA